MLFFKEKFYNELSYYRGGHKDLESMFELALEYIEKLEEEDEQQVTDYENAMEEELRDAVDVIESQLEIIKDIVR
ncbi:sliding clamp inhibitor [Staphylococcus phage Twort]|uniref:Gene product 168 n=2 Tax=Staphylococcus phage Twort (strain DSM 17442 / HER 48) TaxID=2908167 RepID=GP168_BPTWO|nr:DNA sliding clamp inhibitor; arrest of S.aureus DNA synthesis [Staphylococcus phage Twort]Q4Z971.1 RecName: Full=Gene product 168; Short=gp168 [Staphylococcus phage Twort DSM 17442]7EVP_C Chain C, Sliding clamp inhibitor [Twortvirus twort]7EVP_D Chain D, Sliding clamp inhibitor [Twortvirus twort]AAX92440.1 ORF168 [Staphylococcus phage Twort]QIW89171.1 sliding clamp inhibitor [Staphylococcus phage Twort]